MPDPTRLKLAVLISGGGRTLLNLLERSETGTLSADVAIVVSSSPAAGGLQYAHERGIPTLVVERSRHADTRSFSDAIFDACREAGADYVVMAGFLKHVLLPDDFRLRAINIHPSLIPSFSGTGYYGMHVHRAAVEYGVKVSGCTVHFVDDDYDHGPILMQRTVDVLPDDTAEALAARVFEQELDVLPAVIEHLARGEVTIEGRKVRFRTD